MPRNFLIAYSAREGSTAIISLLSAQAGVRVPLMEELDAYQFADHGLDISRLEAMDQVYATGRFDHSPRYDGLFPLRDEPVQSIGFKMRGQGRTRVLAPILLKHRVTVFWLVRRDFDDLVASLYLTSAGKRDLPKRFRLQHPQFEVMTSRGAKGDHFISAYDQVRVTARTPALLRIARRVLAVRRSIQGDMRRLMRRGVPVVPVFYEDFLADRMGFLRAFLNELGFAQDHPLEDKTLMRKVNRLPAKEKVRLPVLDARRVRYWTLRRRYRQMVREADAMRHGGTSQGAARAAQAAADTT